MKPKHHQSKEDNEPLLRRRDVDDGDSRQNRRRAQIETKPRPLATLPPTPNHIRKYEDPNAGLENFTKKLVKEQFRAIKQSPDTVRITTTETQELEMEANLLEQAYMEEVRELARQDFWFFITHVLFPRTWRNYYTEDFHKWYADQCQAIAPGENWLILAPRQSRKTFIGTIAYSVWMIIKDPNIRILVTAAKKEFAEKIVSGIRNCFLQANSDTELATGFQKFFREYVITLKSTARGLSRQETKKKLLRSLEFTHPLKTSSTIDPTVKADYIGGASAGSRCDLWLPEDIIDEKNIATPELAAKTTRQFLAHLPLVDRQGKYGIIFAKGTRYSFLDTYGTLIGDNLDDATLRANLGEDANQKGLFNIVIRHVLEDPSTPCTFCPEHITERFPHGNPTLDPEGRHICAPLFTREQALNELELCKRDPNMGEAFWWHQYMNICRSPQEQKLREEWFVGMQSDLRRWPDVKRRVLLVDAADKDFQKAGQGDYTAFLFVEYDSEARVLLTYGERSNAWTQEEAYDAILANCQRLNWWPTVLVKEKVSNDAWLTHLQSRFQAMYHPVLPLPIPRAEGRNTKKKLDWIVNALQAPLEQGGQIVIGRDFPPQLFQRLKTECCNLSQVAHDDVADALSLGFHPLIRPLVNRQPINTPQVTQGGGGITVLNPGYKAPPAPPPPPDPMTRFMEDLNASLQIPSTYTGPSTAADRLKYASLSPEQREALRKLVDSVK